MRKFSLCAALLAIASEALGGGQLPHPPKLSPGAGVTPGGFLFNVIPSTFRLKIYGLDGGTRATYEVQPGEGHVLGVADSGARVTSASAGGVRQRTETSFGETRRPGAARLVFRDPRGNVLAAREPELLAGSGVEIRGDEAYYIRRVAVCRVRKCVRYDPQREGIAAQQPADFGSSLSWRREPKQLQHHSAIFV